MGNVQSFAKPRSALPLKGMPKRLDSDNIPFLQPPSGCDSPYKSFSPSSMQTQWNQGHAKRPSLLECSPNMSLRGEISSYQSPSISVHSHSAPPETARSSSNSHSGSSITSQLSFLSLMCPPGGPRTQHKGDHLGISYSAIPPEVPPHRSFSNSRDAETETALAVVEALEDGIEDDIEIGRRHNWSSGKSIYRSRSRPRLRPHSLLASRHSCQSLEFNFTTYVYTRKCSSPEAPALSSSLENHSGEDHSDETEGPWSPGDDSFVLEGYNDGSTKLRVINLEDEAKPASYLLPSAVTYRLKLQKRYVKSKAQLAEEEELQHKRYSRYGHNFRVTSTVENHTDRTLNCFRGLAVTTF